MNETPAARRPSTLPGPNEPCWCGSGTKYKKCHRGEDSAAARAPSSGASASTAPNATATSNGFRVRPGVVSPRRTVPAHIVRPDYAESGRPGAGQPVNPLTRIDRMRRSCRAAAEVLRQCGQALRPGITTDAIDAICHAAYIERGGFPSTLNYYGFPKSLCTSVNEVVLHGIPDSRPLSAGDIVNLDVTIYLDGMHGDCSATFPVGEVDAESTRLMKVTEECLMLGIEAVKPGRPLNVIGRAIEDHATRAGFGVVRSYCGHGIGEVFHAPLQIVHFYDPNDTLVIEEGMIFTIEPMLTQGAADVAQWDDGWTVVTADGKRSAQFEHTLLVGRDGAEILTVAT